MDQYNPIRSVGGVEVPCPSKYVYKLQDVSENNAGRTEDGKMWKLMIGQCVKLELGWQNVPTSTVSAVLQAFNSEYINVTYLDGKAGTYLTKQFYVGDRQAPAYNTRLGLWENLEFNIIERTCT